MIPYSKYIHAMIYYGTLDEQEWISDMDRLILKLYLSKEDFAPFEDDIRYYLSEVERLEEKSFSKKFVKMKLEHIEKEISDHYRCNDPKFLELIRISSTKFYKDFKSIIAWYKVMLNDILNGESMRGDINRLVQYMDYMKP